MKGEAIRFLRSNTHAPTFTNTIRIFKKYLLCTKHPKDFVNRILNEITHDLRPNYIPSLSPSPSLNPCPSSNPNPSPSSNPSPSLNPRPPPRLITIYSPHYVHLNSLLTKYWHFISDDPSLSTLFPSPPQDCYRRNPTISSTLAKAALPGHPPPPDETTPINIKAIKSRTHKCTNPHCKACPNALGKRILYSTVSRTPYTFTESFTCMDTSLIYCIVCAKCDKMYIGLTSQSIR